MEVGGGAGGEGVGFCLGFVRESGSTHCERGMHTDVINVPPRMGQCLTNSSCESLSFEISRTLGMTRPMKRVISFVRVLFVRTV